MLLNLAASTKLLNVINQYRHLLHVRFIRKYLNISKNLVTEIYIYIYQSIWFTFPKDSFPMQTNIYSKYLNVGLVFLYFCLETKPLFNTLRGTFQVLRGKQTLKSPRDLN